MNSFCRILVCTILFIVRVVPSSAGADSPAADLRKIAVDPALAGSDFGLLVRDLGRRETIFARNKDAFLIPASNQKLFVTAAALLDLGPDFRFRTEILMEKGTLDGAVL